MGIFDIHKEIRKEISERYLKKTGWEKGTWGSPDWWKEPKSRYARRKPIWNKEHHMFEKYYDDYYVFYFPCYFDGYVNIGKNIKNHACYVVGCSNYNFKDNILFEVHSEHDLEVAMKYIINHFENNN